MGLSRLRAGERLALAGGIGLLALLGLRWFAVSTPEADLRAHESGVRSLGVVIVLLLVIAAVTAITLAVTTVQRRQVGLPIVLGVLTAAFGVFATLAIVARLVFQPGLGIGAANPDVDVLLPAVLGLVAALSIVVGGWMSITDERTETSESREQTRRVVPPPQPVPPADAASGRGPGDALADPARP